MCLVSPLGKNLLNATFLFVFLHISAQRSTFTVLPCLKVVPTLLRVGSQVFSLHLQHFIFQFLLVFWNHTSDIGRGARSQMLHVFNYTVFSCSSQINLYNSFANIIACFSLSAKCPSRVSILILLNSRSNSSAFPQI